MLLLLLPLSRFSRVWLCDPIDSSPAGSPVPGILQARTLQWVTISFCNAWKWKVKVKSLSCVRLFETPWTAAYQAPLPMGFSRQSTGVGCHCLLCYKRYMPANCNFLTILCGALQCYFLCLKCLLLWFFYADNWYSSSRVILNIFLSFCGSFLWGVAQRVTQSGDPQRNQMVHLRTKRHQWFSTLWLGPGTLPLATTCKRPQLSQEIGTK